MSRSLAVAYSMKKKKCASGGVVKSGDPEMDYAEGGEVQTTPNDGPVSEDEAKKFAKGLGFAKGGEVEKPSTQLDFNDDEVPINTSDMSVEQDVECPHCQKRFSHGGMVANEKGRGVEKLPAEYDDLALRDGLEFKYTGANSGDERGGPSKNDLVSRAMLKKKKR